MKIFYGLILTLFCTACSPTVVQTTKLSSVIENIRNDLEESNTLPVNNFYQWTNQQKEKFDEVVMEVQCQRDNADPIIPIINDSFTLNLTGSFTKSGQFGIAASTSNPNITASGSLSKTVGQEISVPVNFVPLSLLPAFEMNKKLQLMQYIFMSNKNDETIIKNEANALIEERNEFSSHIQFLINAYGKQYCFKKYNNTSNFMTIKK